MNEDDATRDFKVTFHVVMPGQIKSSAYSVDVKADSKVEALARAEEEYLKIATTYDVQVKEMPAEKVSAKVITA